MKWILGAALGLLLAAPSYAVNYAIQDGGAGSGCFAFAGGRGCSRATILRIADDVSFRLVAAVRLAPFERQLSMQSKTRR